MVADAMHQPDRRTVCADVARRGARRRYGCDSGACRTSRRVGFGSAHGIHVRAAPVEKERSGGPGLADVEAMRNTLDRPLRRSAQLAARANGVQRPAMTQTMTTARGRRSRRSSPTGSRRVYALPGVQNDHLFDALYKASDRIRTSITRHEQGAAYMALGAALATGRPQAYAVVPGPGLLNTGAALLTAYSMNAPVLALIGADSRCATSAAASAICTRCATRPASSRGWSTSPPASAGRETRPRLVAEAMRAMAHAAGAARPRSNARSTSGARAGRRRSQPPLAAARARDRRGRDPRRRQAPRRGQATR